MVLHMSLQKRSPFYTSVSVSIMYNANNFLVCSFSQVKNAQALLKGENQVNSIKLSVHLERERENAHA